MATPYALVSYESTTSTQDDAKQLIGRKPMLVVAAEQTHGRGRSGAEWQNAPVALAASLAFRPEWPAATWPRLTLIAGLAAAEQIGEGIGLKWPNDVVIDGAKVGGLLTEASDGVVTVGFGANLYWPDAPEGMAAIHDETPGPRARVEVAQKWTEALLAYVDAGPDSWPIERYRARCVTIGREITWQPEGRGTAVDIDASGGLVVNQGGSTTVLSSGAVSEVRTA